MKVFEDVIYEQGEHTIQGFINSNGELEFSIYKSVDGGLIELKDKEYSKEDLSNLLEIELEDFISRKIML